MTSPDEGAGRPSYWHESRQPLPILAFLLPLIIAYEIGLALVLRSSAGVFTNKAHETVLRFFDVFGVSASGGLYLGGAVIVVVLLVWHVLTRAPWRVEPLTPALMAAESLALTVPLIVLGLLLHDRVGPAAAAGPDIAELGFGARLAISIGAGLYEELLFRMMLIAVLHTLLVDVGKLPSITGAAIAVAVSAAAFTVYHPLRDAAGDISFRRIAFYLLAGLYFGGIYVWRGFGVVVGAHAFYDVAVVSVLGGSGE